MDLGCFADKGANYARLPISESAYTASREKVKIMGKVNQKRGLKEARELGNRADRRGDTRDIRRKNHRLEKDRRLTPLQRLFYLLAVHG